MSLSSELIPPKNSIKEYALKVWKQIKVIFLDSSPKRFLLGLATANRRGLALKTRQLDPVEHKSESFVSI